MPFKSEAQRKYFNANREKLEAEGVDVDEWNESSKGKKLPEKAEKKAANYSVIQNMAWISAQQEKSAGNYIRNSLIGAGVGGLAGGIGDWLNEDEDKPDDSIVDGILGGATVGGLGGFGITALRDLPGASRAEGSEFTTWGAKTKPSAAPLPIGELPQYKQESLAERGHTGPRYSSSDLPADSSSSSKSLDDVLPKGYRRDAQRNAERYRDAGNYTIDSAEKDKPFLQDISDKAIDRKVRVRKVSPEEMRAITGGTTDAGSAAAAHRTHVASPQVLLNDGTLRAVDAPKAVRDEILMPRGSVDKNILAHELTHGTQDGYLSGTRRADKRPYYENSVKDLARSRGVGGQRADAIANYLTRPEEEEAYLAQIKRRYYEATGRQVTDQKDARKALEWAQKNPDKVMFDRLLEPTVPEKALGNSEAKKRWIQGLIERMPGLVNNKIPNSGIKTAGLIDMNFNDIRHVAGLAAEVEKQASIGSAILAGAGRIGKGAQGLKGQLGKGTQNLVDFSFFRKGIDPAQVAGFGAGSAGDVAFDPEQRAQLAYGQVPSKLWNPEESTGHNLEGLWRRGFQGLAAGSVANPVRLGRKVSQGAKANIAKNNQALKGHLPEGAKLLDTPDTGDIAWALGKETLPKATALGIGYAPGMIMSTGELPDLVRSTAQNVEATSGDLAEAVRGKGGLAENIKGTGQEVRKGVNDVRKTVADVRQNITGKDADLPKLLKSLKGTADEATKQISEENPLAKLNENLKPLGDLATTANSGLQAAGAGLKSFGGWVKDNSGKLGLGALGAAGLYGLYKVLQNRSKHKEEEEEKKRSRYVYKMPKRASDFGKLAAGRCWEGYEPVPGKKAYSDGSCQPAGGKKEKKSEKKSSDITVLAKIAAVQKQAKNKQLQQAMTIAPHSAIFGGTLGAGVGGIHGLLKDPGYDEETGERKSRLMSALKGLGMGGAIGAGAGALLPPASVLATQGYGKLLLPLHKRIDQLQNRSNEDHRDPAFTREDKA